MDRELQQKLRASHSSFIENKGQWDTRAKFLGKSRNLDLWVTPTGLVLDHYREVKRNGADGIEGHVVSMAFAGSTGAAQVRPEGRAKARQDFISLEGGKRVRSASSFSEVRGQSIYPGIDVRHYFQGSTPRYDLIVRPNADPSQILIEFKGANGVSVDKAGDLTVSTSIGDIQQKGLFAYQTSGNKKSRVSANFRKVGKNSVAIDLGSYDRSRTLIIDPLVYGSYYGGDDGWDEVRAVAADEDAGVYLTGYTRASRYPTIQGPYGFTVRSYDAFLSKFQGDAYAHDYSAIIGGTLQDLGSFVQVDHKGSVWVVGTTQSSNFPGNARPNHFFVQGGNTAFFFTFNGVDTALIPAGSSAAVVQTALEATVGAGNVTVTGGPLPGEIRVEFANAFPGNLTASLPFPPPLGGVAPTITKPTDGFIIRFAKSSTTVLDPLPTQSLIFGGDRSESITGFSIVPNGDPLSPLPVQWAISGNTSSTNPLPEIVGAPLSADGYILRGEHNGTAFTVGPQSTYIGGSIQNNANGLVFDAEGSLFVTGVVGASGVTDTSVNPVFTTTSGVFAGGRLLRGWDAFVRKYDNAGAITYSALLGGNGDDEGSGIALDSAGNVYITGVARSFNFPRTRGVYGENFPPDRIVYVTKINRDASQILYSSHLNTTGNVIPRGIAVDLRGIAYVAGVTDFQLTFPNPPSDPNQPTGIVAMGTVPMAGGPIDPTYDFPNVPQLPTTEGFLLALNPTATGLLYGTYIGGLLDEQVFAPYTDRVGDVWVMGSTDSARSYVLFSSTGAATQYTTAGALPAALISEFAFKRTGDAAGGMSQSNSFGGRNVPLPVAPVNITATHQRDGFVVKLRLALPTIATLTLTPDTIAGGLGASSNGVITLSGPAPAGGVDVTVTLNNPAASFTPGDTQNVTVLNIPAGATTANFVIYSNAVTEATQVQVRASLEGNFKIAQLNVTPWLQQLTISPTTVVGGNQVIGRVRLFQVAPTGGVQVQLLTDSSGLVSFPNGASVTVPEGLDTAAFTINTEGVSIPTIVPVTATLLSVGKNQNLTIDPASLVSVTFNPIRVAGGTSANGTVKLNGKVGSPFSVNLTLPVGTPAGYVLTPTTLNFATGETEKTFVLATPYEPANTQRTVTATRPAQGNYTLQSVAGTLFVDAVDLISFTIDKTSMNPGETAIGTIILSRAAGAGGVVVNISADSGAVTLPAQVVVLAGDTTANFNITATGAANLADTVVTITANRGGASVARQITINKSAMALAVVPGSVVGGANATGTVTLDAPAPAGGLVVSLASSVAAAVVPGSVTILEGTNTASFQITTTDIGSTATATITATLGSLTANAILEVRAPSVASIRFAPSVVKGGRQTTCTVRLESPAPGGGAVVNLQSSLALIANIPATVTVPAGQTSYTFTVTTNRVSRTRATQVTASRGGSSASVILTVRR